MFASAVALILAMTGVVSAAPSKNSEKAAETVESDKHKKQLETARNHLKRAKTNFALGEYAKAAKYWTYAYKIRPEPELLFNIAQAHRLAGERDKARMLYESYLREVPNATNRAEVEGFLSELKDPPKPDEPQKKKRTRKKKTEGEES